MKRYKYELSFGFAVDDQEMQHVLFHVITNEALTPGVDIYPVCVGEQKSISYENPQFVLLNEFEE